MKMTVEEALRHAGLLVTERIRARVQECMPHYIWMFGRGENKSGVCTHCHGVMHGRENLLNPAWAMNDPYIDDLELFPFATQGWNRKDWPQADSPAHGKTGYCSLCGQRIIYRDMSRGHGSLLNQLFYIDWRKSSEDPDIMVMIGYEAEASWRRTIHEFLAPSEVAPDITIEPCLICIFENGRRGQRFTRKWMWELQYELEENRRIPVRGSLGPFVRNCQCNDKYMPFGKLCGVPYYRHRQDTRDALSGTYWGPIFEGLHDFQENPHITLIPEMNAVSAAPCMEYLLKLGMDDLAGSVLNEDGYSPCPLNLKGKNLLDVLGISKDAWAFLKGQKKIPDRAYLKVAHLIMAAKIPLSNRDVWNLSRLHTCVGVDRVIEKSPDAGYARKCLKYILNKKIGASDYADHLRMMQELSIPYSDAEIAFPNDFYRIHAALSQRIKVRNDRAAAEKLAAFLESLLGYCFSAFGLVLNPIPTIPDVIAEGKALHHCVGSYAQRYANGQTILCTLREESALDTPLYTVEFSTLTGSMVQCRGDHNRTRPQDEDRLEGFWRVFNLMRREATANAHARKGRAA